MHFVGLAERRVAGTRARPVDVPTDPTTTTPAAADGRSIDNALSVVVVVVVIVLPTACTLYYSRTHAQIAHPRCIVSYQGRATEGEAGEHTHTR